MEPIPEPWETMLAFGYPNMKNMEPFHSYLEVATSAVLVMKLVALTRNTQFVSLVMVLPGEHYISGAFRHNLPQPTQAQLMRGEFPKTLCMEQVCQVEGATCSSCAPDGSRESVKCQIRQEACVARWTIFLLEYLQRCGRDLCPPKFENQEVDFKPQGKCGVCFSALRGCSVPRIWPIKKRLRLHTVLLFMDPCLYALSTHSSALTFGRMVD